MSNTAGFLLVKVIVYLSVLCCFFFVFVLCAVSNVTRVSGVSIHHCPFCFLSRLLRKLSNHRDMGEEFFLYYKSSNWNTERNRHLL